MPRGLFLSLDGLDGGGKSTQCRLLADWLRNRGYTVTTCVDPGGTAIGGELREIVLHHRQEMTPACEAFLFMASRCQLVAEIIRPALEAGHIVISDRFLLTMSSIKATPAGWMSNNSGKSAAFRRAASNQTDLRARFAIGASAFTPRAGLADRVESRPAEYHVRVRAGFLTEAQRRPERIEIVDASQRREVQQQIRQAVLALLEEGASDVVAARQGT